MHHWAQCESPAYLRDLARHARSGRWPTLVAVAGGGGYLWAASPRVGRAIIVDRNEAQLQYCAMFSELAVSASSLSEFIEFATGRALLRARPVALSPDQDERVLSRRRASLGDDLDSAWTRATEALSYDSARRALTDRVTGVRVHVDGLNDERFVDARAQFMGLYARRGPFESEQSFQRLRAWLQACQFDWICADLVSLDYASIDSAFILAVGNADAFWATPNDAIRAAADGSARHPYCYISWRRTFDSRTRGDAGRGLRGAHAVVVGSAAAPAGLASARHVASLDELTWRHFDHTSCIWQPARPPEQHERVKFIQQVRRQGFSRAVAVESSAGDARAWAEAMTQADGWNSFTLECEQTPGGRCVARLALHGDLRRPSELPVANPTDTAHANSVVSGGRKLVVYTQWDDTSTMALYAGLVDAAQSALRLPVEFVREFERAAALARKNTIIVTNHILRPHELARLCRDGARVIGGRCLSRHEQMVFLDAVGAQPAPWLPATADAAARAHDDWACEWILHKRSGTFRGAGVSILRRDDALSPAYHAAGDIFCSIADSPQLYKLEFVCGVPIHGWTLVPHHVLHFTDKSLDARLDTRRRPWSGWRHGELARRMRATGDSLRDFGHVSIDLMEFGGILRPIEINTGEVATWWTVQERGFTRRWLEAYVAALARVTACVPL